MKRVPLVRYDENGKRIVLGEADIEVRVSEDGTKVVAGMLHLSEAGVDNAMFIHNAVRADAPSIGLKYSPEDV